MVHVMDYIAALPNLVHVICSLDISFIYFLHPAPHPYACVNQEDSLLKPFISAWFMERTHSRTKVTYCKLYISFQDKEAKRMKEALRQAAVEKCVDPPEYNPREVRNKLLLQPWSIAFRSLEIASLLLGFALDVLLDKVGA